MDTLVRWTPHWNSYCLSLVAKEKEEAVSKGIPPRSNG